MSWFSSETLLDLSRSAAGIAVNWWIQSGLLIAAGLAVGRVCRRQGSAVQSAVYRTTLAGVIVAPLVTWGLYYVGVSGWSVEMPETWSLVEEMPTGEVAAVGDEKAESSSQIDESELVALWASNAAMSDEIHDNSIQMERDVEMALDMPSEPSALGLLTRTADTPSAQFRPDAISVFTLHRFGVVAIGISATWLLIAAALALRLAIACDVSVEFVTAQHRPSNRCKSLATNLPRACELSRQRC